MSESRIGPELRVVDVVKRYSPEVSVGPISFDVYPGEFLSLLGPSGCGKTTTLRCIAGFEDISAGSIWLGGSRLDRISAHRRGLGFVFQQYALFPHLTVFDNVAFGLRLARVDRSSIERRVLTMLELVELRDVSRRFPNELSGGQQQRVAIARAMVIEPQVMLFDEPLSNLDFKLRVQMRRELRDLQRRLGKTTIYVTHDQTEALALSHRIAVLSQGRIEQIGTPKDIYERPATPFVAEFMGNANLLRGRVVAFEKGQATIEIDAPVRLTAEIDSAKLDEPIVVMLRPEYILVGEPGIAMPEMDHCYPAHVVETSYLGDSLALTIQITERMTITAVAKATVRNQRLASGGSVTVGFSSADLHVLQS